MTRAEMLPGDLSTFNVVDAVQVLVSSSREKPACSTGVWLWLDPVRSRASPGARWNVSSGASDIAQFERVWSAP